MSVLLNKKDFRNSFEIGSHALRKGRASIENQIYFITFATKNRKPFFAEYDVAVNCCFNLTRAEVWPSATLLCWVLMPNHFHGLVQLNELEALPRIVSRLKAHLTRSLRPQLKITGSLWQESYHDHALRNAENMLDIARYIVMNPVRVKLCKRVGDYPFWDAVWL